MLERKHKFTEEMLKLLLKSFGYQKKLIGVEAHDFLDKIGTNYGVRVVEINNNPILLERKT